MEGKGALCQNGKVARISRADNVKRLLPYWQDRMKDLPYSVTGVAEAAGLAADNVQKIMDGRNDNPKRKTVEAIESAIDFLRDTCPFCHRGGLQEALGHGSDRGVEEGRAKGKAPR